MEFAKNPTFAFTIEIVWPIIVVVLPEATVSALEVASLVDQ